MRRAMADQRRPSRRQGLGGGRRSRREPRRAVRRRRDRPGRHRIERPDIGNLFPALRHARQSGFDFEAPLAAAITGQHQITLLLVFAAGQVEEIELPVSAIDTQAARSTHFDTEPGRRLQIDTPDIIDGALVAPVVGNLEISGWALARVGVAAVEIAIDDQPVAIADHGLRRLDIRAPPFPIGRVRSPAASPHCCRIASCRPARMR